MSLLASKDRATKASARNFSPLSGETLQEVSLGPSPHMVLTLRQPSYQEIVLVASLFDLSHSLVFRKNFGLLCIILHPVALFQQSSPRCPLRDSISEPFFLLLTGVSDHILVTAGSLGPQGPSTIAFQHYVDKGKPRGFQSARQQCSGGVRVTDIGRELSSLLG